MGLLDRIANYFRDWDGIDETAPKMELDIHELRYIADINVERCRLIRHLNEANLKTEEIRAKVIDDAIEIFLEYGCVCVEWNKSLSKEKLVDDVIRQVIGQVVYKLEKLKGGSE